MIAAVKGVRASAFTCDAFIHVSVRARDHKLV